MSDRNEKYRQKIIEVCQPHIQEQIVAVGQFQPKGALGAAGLMMGVSGAAGMIMRGKSKKDAGGLPHNGLYALSPTTLYAFDAKPKGFGWKVKALVATIPRANFQASAGSGTMTDQVTLNFQDGTTLSLESMAMGAKGFNENIIQQLVAGVPGAAPPPAPPPAAPPPPPPAG